MMRYADLLTAWGALRLVEKDGALVQVDFQSGRRPLVAAAQWQWDPQALAPYLAEFAAYFAGQLRQFSLPCAPQGTPFQQRIWQRLRQIGYGDVISYGELACELDQPGASRAIGGAVGRNPLSVIIPCHRVVGHDGRLTGYAGGLDLKVALLTLEGCHVAAGGRVRAAVSGGR